MPISDLKVEAADYIGHDVDSLSHRPSADGVDAETLQKRFDAAAKEVVGPALNALIDALAATTADDSGAANVGVEAITGVTGANVQAILEDLKEQIDASNLGEIGDGSLTDEKLSAADTEILSRFAAHVIDFASHFRYLGNTGGTATAYTATDAGFTFTTTGVNLMAVRAHVECGTAATLNINGGGAKTIRTNAAPSLVAGQMKLNGVYLLMWYPTAPGTLYLLNPETVSMTLGIDDITGLQTALDGKAAASHAQAISTVTGLQTALDGKSSTSHNHSGVYQPVGSYAAALHGHAQGEVSGLVSALAGKSDSSHTHTNFTALHADSLEIHGNSAPDAASVANIYYSTNGTPPSAVPNGTLFLHYS
jgi:hypothetical protein